MTEFPHSEALDVIVRFHDPSRIFELRRAIFALVCQSYRPVSIFLVTQRFTDEQIGQLNADLQRTLKIDATVILKILNLTFLQPEDARSSLLNLGIRDATGRYLAFLDHDDLVFPHGYAALIEELSQSKSQIAFGGIAMKTVDVLADALITEKRLSFQGSNLFDLFEDNFCPIHSFVIDRKNVDSNDLRFDESLSMFEDYDFLLRICARYKSSFRLICLVIGDYYLKNDASNTLAGNTSRSATALRQIRMAGRIVQARRREYLLSPVVQTQMGFLPTARQLSIQQALQHFGES